MCLMARSYRVGGGKTPGTCTAGSIIGQGITFKILTDQAGEIFYISPPLPGSTHDVTAIRNTEAYSVIRKTGDKGHRYLASITSIAANANTPPAMRTA